MKRSPICAEMVKMFEGLKLCPYRDSVGVLTIGYGHTRNPGEGYITKEEAEKLLEDDLRYFEGHVVFLLQDMGGDVPSFMYDALISFAFNLGASALEHSTLLKKFKEGDNRGAAAEFSRWVYAGGKPLPGLIKRRRAEAVRFLGGDFPLVASCYHGEVR